MSVNSSVNKQFEKMFEIFNKEFFESELEMPLFRFQSKCGDGSFNPDAVIDQGTKYSHEIIVPIEVLGDKIENIAACLLHNMIHYWAFIKGYKVSCNNDFYHNKNFKSMAEYCGLETEYDETKGWMTSASTSFAESCKKYGFKKTWRNRYINNAGLKPSSTRKYICPCCGNSFRATKNIRVMCMDCNEQFVLA